jgi:histidyl-tRNA synthetase
MKDIVNQEGQLFTYFIKNASAIAQRHGFNYIETPILEETALFKRSVGESSDIVNKEMYQFIDKGENDVCLRPEGTAGVVRSFIQNKLDRAGGVHRYYYYGSMFRYERPQKGRLRQFHQFGCESFGVQSVYEDAAVILLIKEILEFFGIKYKLLLNSLGCSECMPSYKQTLVSHLNTIKSNLCEDCHTRIHTNSIRVLDCKNESCKTALHNAPKITHNLCSNCHKDFEQLKAILDFNDVVYTIDTNLVRGLDYYTQTAFEFVSDEIGAQSAIAGGGRYDKLVEFLGGRTTPAIGFAIGIERIWELIVQKQEEQSSYYFGALDDSAVDLLLKACQQKRKTAPCFIEYTPRGFNKHFKNAQKLNARYMGIIGQEELKTQCIVLKDLQTKEEQTILIKDL